MKNKKKAATTSNGRTAPNTDGKHTNKFVNTEIIGELLYSTGTGEIMIVSENIRLYTTVPRYSLPYLPAFAHAFAQRIGIPNIAETEQNLLEYAKGDVQHTSPRDYQLTPKEWDEIPYNVKQIWAEITYRIEIAAKLRLPIY